VIFLKVFQNEVKFTLITKKNPIKGKNNFKTESVLKGKYFEISNSLRQAAVSYYHRKDSKNRFNILNAQQHREARPKNKNTDFVIRIHGLINGLGIMFLNLHCTNS